MAIAIFMQRSGIEIVIRRSAGISVLTKNADLFSKVEMFYIMLNYADVSKTNIEQRRFWRCALLAIM